MLTRPLSPTAPRPGPRAAAQRGIVLLVALVVLVAMSLAAVGLMRSGLTGNRIAGNLAFQQAATQSADVGIETAIAWLEANNTGTTLYDNIDIDVPNGKPIGYFATRQDPAAGTSWEAYWNATLAATARVNTLAPDAAGNTVSFVIQRLCDTVGNPTAAGVNCSASPAALGGEGSSKGSGEVALLAPQQPYYRITVRVTGPRNTLSLVQAIVSL